MSSISVAGPSQSTGLIGRCTGSITVIPSQLTGLSYFYVYSVNLIPYSAD